MEPNRGVEVRDLRVLVTRTGGEQWSDMDLLRLFLVGSGWKVTVVAVDSGQVLAEKRVGRRGAAERVRDRFVRVAAGGGVDATDPARIKRLLGV